MSNSPTIPAAIVSGGSTGIGFASVRALRRAGMSVGFFSSSSAKVHAAREALEAEEGPPIFADTVDIRDQAAVASFHSEAERQLGAIGALVCNAGISGMREGARIPLHETTLEEWDEVLSTNTTGAFNCARACLPRMTAQGYGRIVLVGSIAARATPKLVGSAYVTSKAALTGLMRAIIREYGDRGITCNLVAPGSILTDIVTYMTPEHLEQVAARIPARRLGTPDDIAFMIETLCRPSASFCNGAVIDINGGEYIAV